MATVIKAGEAATLLRRLSTVDLADHLKEADKVVATAHRKAEWIVADAKAWAKKIWEDARQTGYDIGYNEGRQTGMTAGHDAALKEASERFVREHADIVADLERMVSEVDRIKKDLRIAAERDLLEFSVQIASRMTFAVGNLCPEAAAENLRRAIRQVGEKTDLTVRIHPQDRTYMDTFVESVLKKLEVAESIRLIEDESVRPGGCLVETGRTRIDATLDSQVAQIVSLLLGTHADGGVAGDEGGPTR